MNLINDNLYSKPTYNPTIKKEIDNIKYKFLFDNFRDSIFFIDKDGHILEANKVATETYGYELEEFYQLTIKDIRTAESLSYFNPQFEEAISKGILFETTHIKKDGTVFPVEVSSKGTKLREDTIVMSVIRDISEKKIAENNLLFLANNDYLTNIPNRRYVLNNFLQMCKLSQHENYKLAAIFFDIDKFKLINDTYGHNIGDEVLKEISSRIRKSIRDIDIFGRMGGDEFIILQSHVTTKEDVVDMINKIINEFTKPIIKNESAIMVNTSIGVSVFPDDSTDIDVLLSFADKAMYESKKEIGNTYRFYNSLKWSQ